MASLLETLFEQNEKLLAGATGTRTAVADLTAGSRTTQGELEKNKQTSNVLDVAKVSLDAAAALQVAEENRRAASALGVNMDDPSSLVVQTAEIARGAVARANAETTAAINKRNAPFGENILSSIASMFTIPIHEQAVAQETKVAADATARLNTLNQAAQIQFRTNEAMKREVTSAAVANSVERAVVQGNEALLLLKEKNARSNIDDLIKVLALDKEAVAILQQSYNNEVQADQIRRAKELFKLQREEYEQRLKDKKAIEEEAQLFVDTINAGRAVYGLPGMNKAEINLYMRTGGKAKAMLDQWYDSGALKKSTGISNISSSPAASMVLLDQAQVRFPVEDPRSKLQDFIESAAREYRESAQGRAATKPEEILNGVNTVALGRAAQQQKLIKPGDQSNIYAALPFSALVKSKTVQDTALYSKVLKAQEDAGIVDIPVEQIVNQAIAAVAKGTLTIDEAAAGVTDYAAVIGAYNNVYKNYRSMGLPSQNSYITQIRGTNGPTLTVDLLQEAQVKAAIMRMQLAGTLDAARQGLPGFSFGLPNENLTGQKK